MGKVMIVLGSPSDRSKMDSAISYLIGKATVEVRIISAYRNPEKLRNVITSSDADVFIAGAGMAAALPGAIASYTTKPVIGVPLSGSALNGIDALFAIAQMPRGVPVATVAIDGAENAAILALEIIGIRDINSEDAIYALREEMRVDSDRKDHEYTTDIALKQKEYFAREEYERR